MKRLYVGQIDKALLFGLLIFMFPASTAAQVQNYYVATTGSDTNDGSQAHPWATINHADSALRVGTAGTCTATSGWNSTSGVGACIHVASGLTQVRSQLPRAAQPLPAFIMYPTRNTVLV